MHRLKNPHAWPSSFLSSLELLCHAKAFLTRHETCWYVHQNAHFLRDVLKFHIPQRQNRRFPATFLMDLPQNRRFVRSFRRFSSPVRKYHACHGIYTLPPLPATLTMRFAKNTQHATSKVLRVPRKVRSEVSKVLRLPRKMQYIFWKRGKSIAPATQNEFLHVMKQVEVSQSATPATRNEALRRWKAPKVAPFAEFRIGTAIRTSRGHLRTVANGCGDSCGRKRNVRRTQLYPHTPRVKREPLLRIRESKRHQHTPYMSVPCVSQTPTKNSRNLWKIKWFSLVLPLFSLGFHWWTPRVFSARRWPWPGPRCWHCWPPAALLGAASTSDPPPGADRGEANRAKCRNRSWTRFQSFMASRKSLRDIICWIRKIIASGIIASGYAKIDPHREKSTDGGKDIF